MPPILEEVISVDDFALLMNDMNKIIKQNNPFSPQMWAVLTMTLGIAFCPMKKRVEANAAEVNEFLRNSSMLGVRGIQGKYFPPNGSYYGYVEFAFSSEEIEIEEVSQLS